MLTTLKMSMKSGEAGKRQPQPVPDTPEHVLQQFGMKGRVVAVNGAAAGIGYAVAEAMAEAGADVAMWYNTNSEAISKAAALSEKLGIKAKAYQVPVTEPSKVEEAIRQVIEDFGKLDVFVANAGAGNSKRVLHMTIDEYRALTSVNFDGVFYCAKYAGAVFEKQGFGNLIITSSISAHIVNVPVDQPVRIATSQSSMTRTLLTQKIGVQCHQGSHHSPRKELSTRMERFCSVCMF